MVPALLEVESASEVEPDAELPLVELASVVGQPAGAVRAGWAQVVERA